MKAKTFLLVLMVLVGACSLRSKDKGTENQAMLQDSNEFEFAVDNVDDVLTENTGEENTSTAPENFQEESVAKVEDKKVQTADHVKDEFLDEVGPAPEEPAFEEFKVADTVNKDPMKTQEQVIDTPITPLAIAPVESEKALEEVAMEYGDQFQEYQVQSGDTLMMIGFKLFGDYRTWKQLKEWNKLSSMELRKGMMLKYRPMLNESFSWRPNGEPHLVKKGEYLGSISFDKYGTSRRWKEIFENNQPLLRDPNLIFAGFTIYYVPDKRSVASEK